MTVGKRGAKAARRGRPRSADREEHLAERRQTLLDCAIVAVERDGPTATMTRMAAQAGVTKPVLYRYFRDRSGLYEAIAASFAGELLHRLRGALAKAEPGRPQLEAGIDAYLAHIERHPGVYRFLTQRVPAEGVDGVQLVTRYVDRVADEVAAVLHDVGGPTVRPQEAQLLAHGITGMVQLAGEAWLKDGSMRRADAVSSLTEVLWTGFSTRI